jgi:hypothetical protein
LIEELASERGDALEISPLTLGEKRVESEGALAGSADSRDDDEFAARQTDFDVAEVVRASAANLDPTVIARQLSILLPALDLEMLKPPREERAEYRVGIPGEAGGVSGGEPGQSGRAGSVSDRRTSD